MQEIGLRPLPLRPTCLAEGPGWGLGLATMRKAPPGASAAWSMKQEPPPPPESDHRPGQAKIASSGWSSQAAAKPFRFVAPAATCIGQNFTGGFRTKPSALVPNNSPPPCPTALTSLPAQKPPPPRPRYPQVSCSSPSKGPGRDGEGAQRGCIQAPKRSKGSGWRQATPKT